MTSVIAHRGAPALEPENTLASFRRAVEVGADMVELDVRRSADGALVVHHEADLPDGRAVVDTRAGDLPSAVPSLHEALDACAGVPVDVEVKNHSYEPGYEVDRRLARDALAVVRSRDEIDRVVISSFDLESVDAVRAANREVATAWLVEEPVADAVAVLLARRHQALHPAWELVTPELIAAHHRAGLAVNCWTCDDPDAIVRLALWGVDGIFTNVADLALELLGRRR